MTYFLTYLLIFGNENDDGWLGGVMVRTLDLCLAVAGSNPGHHTAWLFLR